MAKLPAHLAPLLRHQNKALQAEGEASGTTETLASAESAERLAKKTRHREKQKLARAERHKKLETEREDAKARAVAAVAAEAKAQAQAEVKAQRSFALKRKASKAKRSARKANRTDAVGTLVDPEGAQRDAKLIKTLEARLGIGGDPAKRQRVEQKIFSELGFEDDLLLGGEEPPSSDDEAQSGEVAAKSTALEGSGTEQAGNQHLSELLQGILVSTPSATARRRKGAVRQKPGHRPQRRTESL